MGDFNLPDIDWSLDGVRVTSGYTDNFVDTILLSKLADCQMNGKLQISLPSLKRGQAST
jgi:hypothetical protein